MLYSGSALLMSMHFIHLYVCHYNNKTLCCHVMLCYVMLCYVMLCHVKSGLARTDGVLAYDHRGWPTTTLINITASATRPAGEPMLARDR